MGALAQDIRYGLRGLAKSPGFTAAAVIVLAVGIGANTAIFSVVSAVLLKPLPFPQPERLVSVPHVPPEDIFPGRSTFSVSPANYFDWKAQNEVFQQMAIWTEVSIVLTGSGHPDSLTAGMVSSEFLSVLGVTPFSGRLFAKGDDEAGHVVVLSEELWRARFGSNPSTVGSSIVLDGQSHTVIGILPKAAAFPADATMWIPLVFTPEERALRGIHDYMVLARLKPGVSLAGARAQMNAISARLAQQYPADDKGWGATVIPLHEDLVGDVRPALWMLLGAVGFVLLIACANVANLVLARTLARRKEIGVRAALGATRARIVRQLLAETTLVALAGGALGLLVAGAGVHAIVAFLGDQVPLVSETRVDAPVLGFTLGIALVTGLLAGAVPAWRLTRADPNEALQQGGRADTDAGNPAMRGALVVAEVALALVLLVGAGLLVRSLGRLRGVNPGFDPHGLLTAYVSLPDGKYSPPQAQSAFYQQTLERLRAIPGVVAAGAINTLPLTDGGSTQPVAIEGHAAASLAEQPEVAVRVLTTDTLKALRIRLLRGRDIAATDTETAPAAVLVSESMARRFWPGEDAVGKRLTLTCVPGVLREVVGIVADVKLRGLARTEPIAALYLPHSQRPRQTMALVVRTAGDPRGVARAVEAAVHAIDPDQPLEHLQTMEEHLGDSLARARFTMLLLAAFAGVALLLSAIGIYSVLSYTVRRRTREIGIRMALGADGGNLVRFVVAEGMRPALLGLALGLAASLALGRALEGLVFGIRATDPLTLATVTALLALVALAACAVPAWRASRVEPTQALQEG